VYAWEGLAPERVEVIAPCIDAFSPKNQSLQPGAGSAILKAAGILSGRPEREPAFCRQNGAPAFVSRRAEITQDVPLPAAAPLVTQISRWDRLKDPVGVLRGFVQHVPPDLGAHLVLAGPAATAVSDDPEGEDVLAEVRTEREQLPPEARQRVHLACLPMDDLEENAAIVNALQRHAAVVVQKSLAEGFGLTVAEGMWKRRALVGSRVGGIQDQLVHGTTGLLVDEPSDLPTFGHAVTALLTDRDCARRMGESAQERVRDRYLASSHLTDYLALFDRVLGRA
jgi:trehalose synthase